MRHFVSCDGPVQCKQLVVVQIRQLVGFVRKICFYHYICIAIYKQVYHIVAKTIHFTLATFTITVLIGCRRKLIWNVRKNNVHTPYYPELSETERNGYRWLPRCSSTFHPHSLSQCSQPWTANISLFQDNTVVQSRSRSKFGNSPLGLPVFSYAYLEERFGARSSHYF
jgi:hypothetical protein